MEVFKQDPFELDIGSTKGSFQKVLDSQRELFHYQIGQLQTLVLTQCKLTGVNPLSQEMAAGALSIEIGKRPRDLLNPKAVKYMQALFSIKDTISKKESREISARFNVTVTQVRDFFSTQRSRVRKFVRISREKVTRSGACKELEDGPTAACSDPMVPIDQVPLNSVAPSVVEEVPCCSTQDAALPGLNDIDNNFLENIFSLMRKEETFSGQVKLMEWILKIENSSLLYWFLTKGGVMILATWLSQAASEEQTSFLVVILKVLCHLPLHKALPVHMSAILPSVNKLRFYRTSDVSNRAKSLLSRWSKIFARSQAIKKPNAVGIGEILGDESWQSELDTSDASLTPSFENLENSRRDPPQAIKLLTASTDDSNKKQNREIRQRRKVQLVEHPGQKTVGRSQPAGKAVPASQSRPMSADDIQKAKMRAQFMQSKYGKSGTSSNESIQVKSEGPQNAMLPAYREPIRPKVEEFRKPQIIPSKVSIKPEAPVVPKPCLDPNEDVVEKCKRVQIQIPWQMPSEFKIPAAWRVSAGENSKEVEVQKNRIHREREIIYYRFQDIPSDPRDPWDREMDCDDSLTLEIPAEQPMEPDGAETDISPQADQPNAVASVAVNGTAISTGAVEPDLELLAVLLKNPELVFALTSGQAGNMSSEDKVRLLDMIKKNGLGPSANANGLVGDNVKERVEVSLPSPTPSADPSTSGWKPETVRNPFSRQISAKREMNSYDGVVTTSPIIAEKFPAPGLVHSQIQHVKVAPSSTTQFSQQLQMPNSNIPLHQTLPINAPVYQMPPSKLVQPVASITASSTSLMIARSVPERQPMTVSLPPLLPTPSTQLPRLPEPPLWSTPPPYPEPWGGGGRQGMAPIAHQNEYIPTLRESLQQPSQPRLNPWERNEFAGEEVFESWSPNRSPGGRPLECMARGEYIEPGMSSNWGYRPDRPRQHTSFRHYEHSRNENSNDGRWRDRSRGWRR
ncbi:hypothetical protein RJ641_030929 [Dillenia turbinata]|uniref:Homeobox domain-containing protein n=1 Tax=Dillenia turbinata TaxID=194707 RepID=A0AAN8VX62_9MAGN